LCREAAPRVVPFLAEMAGVTFPDEPELAAARADPCLLSQQVAAAWRTWLEAECAARPVLLVLEDLQWADPASLLLVAEVLRALAAGADLRSADQPASPLEMVQARLDALAPPVQRVLRAAAGLGESFRATALVAALGEVAIDVDAALATLIDREVIF